MGGRCMIVAEIAPSRRYDFASQLAFSLGSDGRGFDAMIMRALPGCSSVCKTDSVVDRTGVDYVAYLDKPATVNIDMKLRSGGCSRFWSNGEEQIALETWSVMPSSLCPQGRVGWTLDAAKNTHYTLHAFDPEDSRRAFLLPFQLLRKAFEANRDEWMEKYFVDIQRSNRWRSQCVFVPIRTVVRAMNVGMLVVE